MAERKVKIESIAMDDIERVRNERRFPVQLLDYWDRIRSPRAMPSEKDLSPEDIPHIWEHCYLIQVHDLHKRQKVDFTYLGSELLRTYKEHLSDEEATDIISPGASRLAQNFQQVIDARAPIMQAGEFENMHGNIVKFRQCLLPLGEKDAHVDAVFGCARLKVYP